MQEKNSQSTTGLQPGLSQTMENVTFGFTNKKYFQAQEQIMPRVPTVPTQNWVLSHFITISPLLMEENMAQNEAQPHTKV